jgi:hypothetical protein
VNGTDCCPGEPFMGDPNGLHSFDCPVYEANMRGFEALSGGITPRGTQRKDDAVTTLPEPWQLYPMPAEQVSAIQQHIARQAEVAVQRDRIATRPNRAALYAAIDHAIVNMGGETDPIGFRDWDHDDIAESVTQSVMLALGCDTSTET